jgi:phage baseplate assembly protein gpV
MSFLPIDPTRSRAFGTSKIRGVQLAIVVDNKDGEGNPGYRVKLKFPWLNDQETSFWARIAVPMGGSDRGTYVLPEIDDQVLVVFEHGDIGRPIVIGGLWSKKQEPVEVNQSGENNTKLVKSRSGHRIIFDDKEGAEKIIIVDKTKKNRIVLDSARKLVQIESDGDVEVRAKGNLILHASALKIGATDTITGKAESLLTHAQKTFSVKATSGITIGGGTTTINVSNAAATSVSGSGAGELGAPGAEAPVAQAAATGGSGGAGGAATRGGSGAGGPTARGPVNGNQATAGSSASGGGDPPGDSDGWIALELVDNDGKPVPMIRYKVTGPDGAEQTGLTDSDGKARVEGLTPGDCTVTFPDLHAGEWGRG